MLETSAASSLHCVGCRGTQRHACLTFPCPVPHEHLHHSGPRPQEEGVGQVGGVRRHKEVGRGHGLQLLPEGGPCAKLRDMHL